MPGDHPRVPLYEYQCKKCHHRFERIQKISDRDPHCPECGGKVERLLHAPAVQFKGSGWYVTDYARKASSKGARKEADSTASESASSKSEEKTESKPKGEKKQEKH